MNKILGYIAIIVIIIQIVISLIYSNQIITNNRQFSQQRLTLDDQQRQIEKLQNQLSTLQSIKTALQSTPSSTLIPITNYQKVNE